MSWANKRSQKSGDTFFGANATTSSNMWWVRSGFVMSPTAHCSILAMSAGEILSLAASAAVTAAAASWATASLAPAIAKTNPSKQCASTFGTDDGTFKTKLLATAQARRRTRHDPSSDSKSPSPSSSNSRSDMSEIASSVSESPSESGS